MPDIITIAALGCGAAIGALAMSLFSSQTVEDLLTKIDELTLIGHEFADENEFLHAQLEAAVKPDQPRDELGRYKPFAANDRSAVA